MDGGLIMTIINGTTPTITFTFSDVAVDSIAVAYLVIKMGRDVLLERDISTATVTEATLSWVLTQEETLALPAGAQISICCDWRLADGTRGRSNIATYGVERTGKNEVI